MSRTGYAAGVIRTARTERANLNWRQRQQQQQKQAGKIGNEFKEVLKAAIKRENNSSLSKENGVYS